MSISNTRLPPGSKGGGGALRPSSRRPIEQGSIDITPAPGRKSRQSCSQGSSSVFPQKGVAAAARQLASSPTVPHFKTGVFHEHVAWAFVKTLREGGDMAVTRDDGRHAFAMINSAESIKA